MYSVQYTLHKLHIFTKFTQVKPSKADYDPLENEQIKPLAATTPTTPKNEIPNKFWAFVEPYCAPLQQDDVKFLEDLIKG